MLQCSQVLGTFWNRIAKIDRTYLAFVNKIEKRGVPLFVTRQRIFVVNVNLKSIF